MVPPLADPETVETVIDSAVEIAQIEADARVEIETIRAAVEITAMETQAETRTDQEEIAWLRDRMNSMEQEVLELREMRLQSLEVQSTPLVSEEAPIVEAEILIPPSMSDETSETQTEATPESVADVLAAPILEIPARRKRRAI